MPSDSEIKTAFQAETDKTNAINYLANQYSLSASYYTLTVEAYSPSASKHARTSGQGNNITVKVNQAYFDRQIATDEGYNKLIHTIGHEFQHVKQRRVDGWRVSSSKEEREFMAYSWEFLEATTVHQIPPMTGSSKTKTKGKALTNYNGMSSLKKTAWATRKGLFDVASA